MVGRRPIVEHRAEVHLRGVRQARCGRATGLGIDRGICLTPVKPEEKLRDIVTANGVAETDVPQVIEDYKACVAETSSGSEYDEKNARDPRANST